MRTTLELINARLEGYQGKGFRNHLGASVIGHACARRGWYIFRWAKRTFFKGRMLRLFDRGNREELSLGKLLQMAGVHVELVDSATGQQFRISDHNGHFGGSLDAKLFGVPEFPMQQVLGEFKTYNEKQFKKLQTTVRKRASHNAALAEVKPEYYVQAILYMDYEDLPGALHFNVCKNNDEIEVLVLQPEPEVAAQYRHRAGQIIASPVPPPRIPNASPGWFICRWCNYVDVCHHHQPKEKNCRTCVHSEPIEEGQWICRKFQYVLSPQEQKTGCLEHHEISED